MNARERPPLPEGGRPESLADGLDASHGTADIDLVACSPEEFIVWLSGYRAGIWQGTAAEIARRQAEDRAVYQMAVRTVHRHSRLPTVPKDKQIPRRWVDRDVAS